MFAPHPTPATPESAADRKVARIERCMAKLEHLSDRGIEMVDGVKADGSVESAEAFAKISRAVRLTIMLEMKLDDALSAYLAGEVVKAEAVRAAAAKDPHAPLKTGKTAQARTLIRDVMDHEIPDPDEYEVLMDALDERLLCDEAYRLIDDLPLRDIVERLCADLRLKPDWKRWTGQGWKPDPPFFRRPCSLFHAPSRSPILADLPGPDLLE